MTASNVTLADRYAAAKAAYDAADAALKALRKEVLETGADVLQGEDNVLTVVLSERKQFDTDAAKKLLTKEQVATCTEVKIITTVRVTEVLKAVA